MVKLTIQRRTIPYCAAKKRKTIAEEKLLEKKINKLEEHICQNISESQKFKLHCELETSKTDLEVLRQAKLTGSMIRSKVNIYESFERPTKFFCSLERQNYVNKLITRLDNGTTIVTDQKSILKEIMLYYKQLYKSRATPESETIQNRFLKQNLFKRLTEDDKRLCEGKITMSELNLVLKT